MPYSSAEAFEKLKSGNRSYMEGGWSGDVSSSARKETALKGQFPYAIVITCSDSRVIPEAVFCAGIGDLFVIRVAGNVVSPQVLGSVEYAAEHLHCPLVLVMGHTGCGAIAASLELACAGPRASGGSHEQARPHVAYISSITDDIIEATRNASDPLDACWRNVRASSGKIREAFKDSPEPLLRNLRVAAAVYDLVSGEVSFDNPPLMLP